jgi:hypothetical protein
MIFYAIRHKPTGDYLPANPRSGNTTVNPSPYQPPRLFRHESKARCALNWWLKGIYGSRQPFRHAVDMEIVEMKLEPIHV